MTDVRVLRGVSSVTRVTDDGNLLPVRGTRDGAAFSADWFLAHALEGRAFGVNTSTGATVDTFTANAGILVAQQDLYVTVLAGTTIIPVYIEVNLEDLGAAGVLDICACASSIADVATTGTSVSIYNMRMDAPVTSTCTCKSVISSNGTSPYSGNFLDFWRGYSGDAPDAHGSSSGHFNQLCQHTSWMASKTFCPPIISGPGSLSIYATTAAGKGFITAIWVEIPTSSIS